MVEQRPSDPSNICPHCCTPLRDGLCPDPNCAKHWPDAGTKRTVPSNERLMRYGIKWNGPREPIATPMDDGYWTPWHVANDEIERLTRERDEYKKLYDAGLATWNPVYKIVLDERDRLRAELATRAAPETPERLTSCPYCDRPADSEGGINHVGGCIGLETVRLNRLQYDALVSKVTPNAQKAGAPHWDCGSCGSSNDPRLDRCRNCAEPR